MKKNKIWRSRRKRALSRRPSDRCSSRVRTRNHVSPGLFPNQNIDARRLANRIFLPFHNILQTAFVRIRFFCFFFYLPNNYALIARREHKSFTSLTHHMIYLHKTVCDHIIMFIYLHEIEYDARACGSLKTIYNIMK